MFNQSIDDDRFENLSTLSHESIEASDAIVHDERADRRECFTYISMIHTALFHHKKRATELGILLPDNFATTLQKVESDMLRLASSIGVQHRFLSVFYLFYNPEIPDLQGKFAQFRPSDYETAFLRINHEGTLQYKLAANALYDAFDQLHGGAASFESIRSLLESAATAFHKISLGNAMLLKTAGSEEFRFLTQYFGEVQVAGKSLRGVNAGDQPWSYIIDLVLGVDLKRVFERAFEGTPSERNYLAHAKTSADVIDHEFRSGEYLHSTYLLPEDYEYLRTIIQKIEVHPEPLTSILSSSFLGDEELEIAAVLHQVIRHYLTASNVHFQLAKRHVPHNANGEQIGSAGTNILRFLKEGLNDEREKIKNQLESKYPKLLKINTIKAAVI